MRWWGGHGAAIVFEWAEQGVLLLERARDETSLLELAERGCDTEASTIICSVIATLHRTSDMPLPELTPLSRWFDALWRMAGRHGGILQGSADAAKFLLEKPVQTGVLHGDIHHRNILDFGPRGWCAIDPKGLIGERGFDYANLFCNPELTTVTCKTRFLRQLEVVGEIAGIERPRLLLWILAYAGLSAAWCMEDGETAATPCAIAGLAFDELGRMAPGPYSCWREPS